jgi:uncharacterized iron-regulated protein
VRLRIVTLRIAVLVLTGCLAAGCTAAPDPPTGRIWDVRAGRIVDEAALLEDLAAADFVLLGEHHDNPEHHRLQARLVEALQARWPQPAPVAFEMMSADQQLAVVEHLQDHPGDAQGLGQALAWPAGGWPDWGMYAPIAAAALAADAEIVAANLPEEAARAVAEQGPAALDPSLVRRTGLAAPLPAPLTAELRSELEEVHCGEVAPERVERMLRVQRARDAVMADRLATLAGRNPGILVAGSGHVRTDRGVPWYLARLRPGARIRSLALVEVTGDEARARRAELPYDYAWFTAPAARDDACAAASP